MPQPQRHAQVTKRDSLVCQTSGVSLGAVSDLNLNEGRRPNQVVQ